MRKTFLIFVLILLPALSMLAQPRAIQYLCTPQSPRAVPQHFMLGSMGGFFTFDEAVAQLDSMQSLYPGLITVKSQIGTSIEGRAIWQVCISDNPGLAEGEEQVLFTALHHSQEPASLQQLIMYMWFLLENYGTDPEITYLVDALEIHFVPVINPDGYVYNQTQNPGGGGTWRKNRRQVDLFYGVDLNRNYGYAFGYDELGSSSLSVHPWYRGDSAFSEPESRAMRDFIEAHDFRLAMNWHAYGNYLIYPWNYETLLTADSTLFEQYSRYLTLESHYRYGTCDQTYGYNSNGDADDWAYGDTTGKGSMLSFTAEIGAAADGFWPDPANITEICRQTLDMNLRFTRLAGRFAVLNDVGPLYLHETDGTIALETQCLGAAAPTVFPVSISGIGPWITGTGTDPLPPALSTLETHHYDYAYHLNPSTPAGTLLQFQVTLGNGLFTWTDTLEKIFTPIDTLFADNGNSLSQWDNSGWSVTTEQSVSVPASFTESPGSDYSLLQSASMEMLSPVQLSGYQSARLQFKARWEMEIAYDWMEVFASSDGGSSWIPLCGRYSSYGSDDEDLGQPLYDGFQPDWLMEEIALDDYLGGPLLIKFTFNSDQTHNFDGVYLDDIYILATDAGVGIARNERQATKFQLCPNPACDHMEVHAHEPVMGALHVDVLDLRGKPVISKVFNNPGMISPEMDISALASGYYVVRLHTADEDLTVKLAVIR